MRPRTRLTLVAALIVVAVGHAYPALADADDETVAGTVVYAVDISDVSTGPDGASETETASGELRIACVGTECAIVREPARLLLSAAALSAGETLVSEFESPSTGSPCSEGRGGRAISVEASATGFTATLSQDPIDWTTCTDDTEAFGHAREVVWTGSVVSADPCVFTQTGCVGDESASALASGDPAAPSVLSALPTPAEAAPTGGQLMTAVLLTIVLVLLVAFPTALLNSAVESASDRMSSWWTGRRARGDRATVGPAVEASPDDAATPAVPVFGRWWWAACGVALAAVISAFVDPQFGFNPGSARVLLSLLISFALDVMIGWVLVIWLLRRLVPGATHSFLFRPLTLLVVVAAVAFSRLTGFEPGIVFGLVAGVAFGALVGKASEARAAMITLGYAFVVALIAWMLYGVLGGGAATGESFWSTLVIESLSAIAVGGMAALPIALFPVRGMAGHSVWVWNRWVWAGCYGVGLFAFFIVLMPMPFSWAGVAWDLSAWIAVYLLYAVGALLAWLLITRPWRRDSDADAHSGDESGAPAGAVAELASKPEPEPAVVAAPDAPAAPPHDGA